MKTLCTGNSLCCGAESHTVVTTAIQNVTFDCFPQYVHAEIFFLQTIHLRIESMVLFLLLFLKMTLSDDRYFM